MPTFAGYEKTKRNFIRQYGKTKGLHYFYAWLNKMNSEGRVQKGRLLPEKRYRYRLKRPVEKGMWRSL